MLKSKRVMWARIVGILMVAWYLGLGLGCSDAGDNNSTNDPDASDVSQLSDAESDTQAQISCDDGLTNGVETDVDCGGAVCRGCDLGQGCVRGEDCDSDVCQEGVCVAASCEETGCPNADETCYKGACVASCAVSADCGETAVFACVDGACVDSCDAVSCGEDEFCYGGECQPNCENNNECLQLKGYLFCDAGRCVAPCEDVVCESGSRCYRGDCYLKCDANAFEDECEADERCIDDGKDICVPTDCSRVHCGMNESCYDGRCIGG